MFLEDFSFAFNGGDFLQANNVLEWVKCWCLCFLNARMPLNEQPVDVQFIHVCLNIMYTLNLEGI